MMVYVARDPLNVDVDRKQAILGVGTSGFRTDIVFPRGNFTNLLLSVRSNEELGILDSDYIEDYDGTDGYITLKRLYDGNRVSYPAVALPAETPAIDNDVFQATISLSSLENTVYEVEGRVRDVIGNYTIFGSVANPIGGENITTLTVEIIDGFSVSYVHNVGPVSLRAARIVDIAERAA